MREILFRGKTPSQDEHFDDGEWKEGFYTCFNGKEHRIYSGYAETDCGDYYPDWCNVRPETVGQYTGLTDKNGTRIFEGDILKYKSIKNENKIGYVMYGTGCFSVKNIYSENRPAIDIVLFETKNEVEVIGNIHDNPELLKEV